VGDASAATVSRICWNGITHLLERYHASAGTVSRICWNGITHLLERYFDGANFQDFCTAKHGYK